MRRVPVVVAVALVLTAGAPPAVAHVPVAPQQVPPHVWYGEAPTGVYQYSTAGTLYGGHGGLMTMPGARIRLDMVTDRPDGVRGQAWLWFNTRTGSTFRVTSCDAEGVPRTRRVTRKTFQALVRRTQEREARVDYDAPANAGAFELTTPCPVLPTGDASEEAPRPVGLPPYEEFREAATGHYEFDWETGVSTMDDRWLVVRRDYGLPEGERPRFEWYDTGVPGSTFVLDFCTHAGDRFYQPVTRLEFLERARWSYFEGSFLYDAERNNGRFAGRINHDAGEHDDDCDAPVREP